MHRRVLRPIASGFASLILLAGLAAACPVCDTESGREVRAGIFNNSFWTTAFLVILPFPALALATGMATRGARDRSAAGATTPLVTAGTLLGIGLGGFVDGILFHQILQLHSMLSARVPKTSVADIEINMFWDGLFHAFTWIITLVGLVRLWKAVSRPGAVLSGRVLSGAMLMGWGLFNLVEGTINHLILDLHHVVEAAPNHLPYDLAFLASGIILTLAGLRMVRRWEAPAYTREPSGSPTP